MFLTDAPRRAAVAWALALAVPALAQTTIIVDNASSLSSFLRTAPQISGPFPDCRSLGETARQCIRRCDSPSA